MKKDDELGGAGGSNPRQQQRVRARMAIGLYSSIVALLGLVWLVSRTDLEMISTRWLLFAFLLILRIGLAHLDISSLALNGSRYFNGVPGRAISWSAVIIFGPVGLWTDIAASLSEFVVKVDSQRGRNEAFTIRPWLTVRELTLIPLRDTAPAILTILLFEIVPLAGTEQYSRLPIPELLVFATLVKSGISILALLPVHIIDVAFIDRRTGLFSGLVTIARSLRMLFGALLLFGLADLSGLVASSFYVPASPWQYLAITIGFSALALFLHYTNRIGLRNEQLARNNRILQRIASVLLGEEPAELILPELLVDYSPKLFPETNFEVRVFTNGMVFKQGSLQPEIADPLFEQFESAQELESGMAATYSSGPYIVEPIVDPENRRVLGGAVLMPDPNFKPPDIIRSTLVSLTELIASSVRQAEIFDQALESQAEAFQAEVFSQAYEAELAIAYERVTQELAIAGQIQNSFLPDAVPELRGWQISVALEPARETSGDYYDFIRLKDGHIGLLIADVADKGIGSALYMALSRTIIRTFATQYHLDPASTLEAANLRILQDTSTDLFVTVFYAVLNPENGSLTYCNAGHNPPFLWQSTESEQPLKLKRTALPLGIFENNDWEQKTITISPGGVLAMYTDGVTEAQDEEEELFGDGRLIQAIEANLDKPTDIIEDKIMGALNSFTQDAPQFDDITLMILQREQ